MDIAALITEIRTDPLVRGYSTKTIAAQYADLFTTYRNRERSSLMGSQIYNSIVPAEWTALTAANQAIVRDIFGLGDVIDIRTGTNTRTQLLNIFGAATTTRANIAANVNQAISRAEELNCSDLTLQYFQYLHSVQVPPLPHA